MHEYVSMSCKFAAYQGSGVYCIAQSALCRPRRSVGQAALTWPTAGVVGCAASPSAVTHPRPNASPGVSLLPHDTQSSDMGLHA